MLNAHESDISILDENLTLLFIILEYYAFVNRIESIKGCRWMR